MGAARLFLVPSDIAGGCEGILTPSCRGMGAGTLAPLVCKPMVLVRVFEAAVKEVDSRGAGASGGEDERDRDARERAPAAFCSKAGLKDNGKSLVNRNRENITYIKI